MSRKSSNSQMSLFNIDNAYLPAADDIGSLIRVDDSLRKLIPREKWEEKSLISTSRDCTTT